MERKLPQRFKNMAEETAGGLLDLIECAVEAARGAEVRIGNLAVIATTGKSQASKRTLCFVPGRNASSAEPADINTAAPCSH